MWGTRAGPAASEYDAVATEIRRRVGPRASRRSSTVYDHRSASELSAVPVTGCVRAAEPAERPKGTFRRISDCGRAQTSPSVGSDSTVSGPDRTQGFFPLQDGHHDRPEGARPHELGE